MKQKLVFTAAIIISFVFQGIAQNVADTVQMSIETINSGILTGQMISETKDSVKIKTKDYGVVAIAKNEIVYHNLVTIETMDGNEFLGEIVREDSLSITLKTNNLGEITISESEIKKKTPVESHQLKDGKLWFENPQSTRYFWAPNGYGLKKGDSYYQNIWILWNQFTYGATDYFSIGAGVIPTFLVGAPTPVFATLKFSVPVVKNKFNLAAGTIAGYVLGEEGAGFGIFYGSATYGSPDKNISLGVGEMFAGGEWAPTPLFNCSGLLRVTSNGYLITENYFLTIDGEFGAVISFGGRSIIKKISLDYGLFIPIASEMDSFIAIPWLGLAIPLGNTKK
jgi:RNase P/RNase MRP subunit p29